MILPFEPVKENYGSQCHNFFISIIMTEPRFKRYFYKKYIALTVKHDNDNLIDYFSDGIYTESSHKGIMEKIHVKGPLSNLRRYIKEAIDSKLYVVLNLNEEYLPYRTAYKNHYFRHDLLIFGYDEKKGTVLAYGFDMQSNYSIREYTFDEIENAYYRMQYEWDYEVHFIRLKRDADVEISGNVIRNELEEYLSGINPVDRVLKDFNYEDNKNLEYVYTGYMGNYYGINVYDYMQKKFFKASRFFAKLNESEKLGVNELRSYNVLITHINMINALVNEYQNEFSLKLSTIDLNNNDYKEIHRRLYKCKLNLMHYYNTGNSKILKKISREMQTIKKLEEECIIRLL